MADAKKKAKFFCENCGAEVPQNAKMCRHCGRFFSSVRCPQCNETGSPSKFAKGCPACGYAFGTPQKTKNIKTKNVRSPAFFSKPSKTAERGAPANGIKDESLPFWVYLVAFLTLILVCAAVLIYLP